MGDGHDGGKRHAATESGRLERILRQCVDEAAGVGVLGGAEDLLGFGALDDFALVQDGDAVAE